MKDKKTHTTNWTDRTTAVVDSRIFDREKWFNKQQSVENEKGRKMSKRRMCGLVGANQTSEGGFNLMSLLILSLSVFSRSPFQTISSRHKQILPYLSKNTRSVGGFPHTSFTAAVMIYMVSATAPQKRTTQNQKLWMKQRSVSLQRGEKAYKQVHRTRLCQQGRC